MSVEEIARKWHDRLLSSEPIDHSAGEAALRGVYGAAGLPEPQRFLWCSSPHEAAWAYLVLVGKTEGYNHAVYQDIERLKTGKDKLAKARASVAEGLGIKEDQVEGYFGRPFYRAEGTNPVTKTLRESYDARMARAQSGNDFLAPHAGGPFKPLHDLEQALHFEGERRGGVSLYRQALTNAGGKQIAILGGRSAQHRLYGNFAYVEIAVDEGLAEAGKFEPTEMQRAIWAAYKAGGMWWPCEEGVVLSERPIAAELAADGPRMKWSDGFTVGGKHEAKLAGPAASSSAPTPRSNARALPAGHAERIAYL